jgi:hypothetical protein
MGKIEGNPRNLLQATLDNSIPTIRKDHKGHKEESRLLKVIQALLNLRTSSNSFSVFVTFVIFVYCKHPFFVCLGLGRAGSTEEMAAQGLEGGHNTRVLSDLLYNADELRPEERTTYNPE